MIRCAVFDFDGTLVDSNAIKRRAFFEVLADLDPQGIRVEAVLNAHPGADRHALTREIARALETQGLLPGGRPASAWAREWAEAYTRLCEREISECAEIPGARAALDWLQARGVDLFLSSSTPTQPLRRLVALRSLSGYFRAIHGAPGSKLEALHAIREQDGVEAAQMLVVGDGEDDRSAALAFGCPFVAVVRGAADRFATAPRWQVRSLDELPDVIERIEAGEARATATR